MVVFTPKDWHDSPAADTPITSAELERIEAGIVEALTQQATELVIGNVELASAAELTTGTDLTRVPSAKRLNDYVTARLAALPGATAASETAAGISEFATAAEITTGTDLTRAVSAKRLNDFVTAAVSAVSGAGGATETTAGIVELASAAEMTAGTDLTRAPSVKRVFDHVAAVVAAVSGTGPASESVAGIVELATPAEMTTGTDLTRAPAVKRVADYVTTAIATLNASITAALAGKASTAGSITQFADVSPATSPVDGAVLTYDSTINAYQPELIGNLYAALGSDGRLATANNPRYYVGALVLNEGAAIPSDTPASTIIFRRAVGGSGSITPVYIGQATANASTTVTVTTTQDYAVGDYVIIGYFASGETPNPTTFPSVTIGGGTGAIGAVTSYLNKTTASTVQAAVLIARCTTLIPTGRTITVTADSARAEHGFTLAKASALLSASVIDQTGGGNAGASVNVSAVTAGATGQAVELAIFMTAFANTAITDRTITGTNGWNAIGATMNAHGASDRSGAMFYKELAAVGTITATATIANGTAGNGGWAATIVTLKAV